MTLRTSGSSSGGGTLSPAYLTLQGPNGVQTTGTQVSGTSSDYTISNFTLTTTGTYTVTVSTSSHGKGTYTDGQPGYAGQPAAQHRRYLQHLRHGRAVSLLRRRHR